MASIDNGFDAFLMFAGSALEGAAFASPLRRSGKSSSWK